MSILKRRVNSSSDFLIILQCHYLSLLCKFAHAFSTLEERIPWKYQFWHFQVFWWKFAKLLMSFSKPQVSFSSNFAWLFSIIEYNSSPLFEVKCCILCTKRTNQGADFLDFLVLRSKFTKFLSFSKQKISFSSNFTPLFFIMRHISSIVFSAETLYNFSKSSLSKYKFGEISSEQSKVWRFVLWWAPFVKISFTEKSTEELSPMTLKSVAEFKEQLSCGFKYDMGNLVNFHPTTQKSKNFTSIGYFCPQYTRSI